MDWLRGMVIYLVNMGFELLVPKDNMLLVFHITGLLMSGYVSYQYVKIKTSDIELVDDINIIKEKHGL